MPGKRHWLFSHQFKKQVLRCALVPNEIANGSMAYFPDCSHYFVFELHHRGRIISVRADPKEMYHMVNDYRIAMGKSIWQYAAEFAFRNLGQKDQQSFLYAFLEVGGADVVSEYVKNPDGLEFIANQIISYGTVFEEERDALMEYVRQISLAEEKIRAGQISYPVFVIDDHYRTGYDEQNTYVWPNNSLTIIYRPYSNHCKNPAPWQISVKVKTLRFLREDGDVISSEETKPVFIPLSNKEMDTLISGISTQLEDLGFTFPCKDPEQYFTVTPHLTMK